MPFGAAMEKFEAFRQVMRPRQFEAGASGRHIDNAAFDRHCFGTEQNLSSPGNQPLRLNPKPSSFVGIFHGQLYKNLDFILSVDYRSLTRRRPVGRCNCGIFTELLSSVRLVKAARGKARPGRASGAAAARLPEKSQPWHVWRLFKQSRPAEAGRFDAFATREGLRTDDADVACDVAAGRARGPVLSRWQ
jgi:hypothetical protein